MPDDPKQVKSLLAIAAKKVAEFVKSGDIELKEKELPQACRELVKKEMIKTLMFSDNDIKTIEEQSKLAFEIIQKRHNSCKKRAADAEKMVESFATATESLNMLENFEDVDEKDVASAKATLKKISDAITALKAKAKKSGEKYARFDAAIDQTLKEVRKRKKTLDAKDAKTAKGSKDSKKPKEVDPDKLFRLDQIRSGVRGLRNEIQKTIFQLNKDPFA
ncbi:MAG: hypothetical protein AAF183_01120 [Pseudomonadota bacterium]